MADDLYWNDTLAWSEQQAALLRRLAVGEGVNEVDWEHVIEEIEDVGRTEVRACESLLRNAMEHLLKLLLWPESGATRHWRRGVLVFLADARGAFTPSMRQKIDLQQLYADAGEIVASSEYGEPGQAVPDTCPFTFEALLARRIDIDGLLAQLRTPPQQ
jgi:hypothetical protein